MDSEENRIAVINSTLEKVKKGIGKGTWQCKFGTMAGVPTKDYEDISYWLVTAINGDYTLQFGYDVKDKVNRVCEYSFLIKKNDAVLYEIRESDGSSDSPELTLIRNYMKILVEEYKKFVESLPE